MGRQEQIDMQTFGSRASGGLEVSLLAPVTFLDQQQYRRRRWQQHLCQYIDLAPARELHCYTVLAGGTRR